MRKLFLIISLIISFLGVFAQKGLVVDKIVAVVADKVILLSDIENQMTLMNILSADARKSASCDMLDQVIANKLLTSQAVLDSIPLSDDEVEEDLERKIDYYIRMAGSQEQFEEYYNKTVDEIKSDFREDIR